MRVVNLRGPVYSFRTYSAHEAKRLGLIDSYRRRGTHEPISKMYKQGDGKMLADALGDWPDAILVETGRYRITAYRPREVLAKPQKA